MQRKFITTLGLLIPLVSLSTIGCFHSQDSRYRVQGSLIGKMINEYLLDYMGHTRDLIVYQNSSIEKAIDSVNHKNSIYTITTSQYIPTAKKWHEQKLRTITIAKDKVIILVHLPHDLQITEPIFDFDYIATHFAQGTILNLRWNQILKNHPPNHQSVVKPTWLGRKGGGKNSGIAKAFHNYLSEFKTIDENEGYEKWPVDHLFDNNKQIVEKIESLEGAISYMSYAQTLTYLKDDAKHCQIYPLQDQQDQAYNLTIPINFVYKTSQNYATNLASNLINQIFSPIFQEILEENLFLTRLTSDEIYLQINNKIAGKNINLKTTDQEIFELTKDTSHRLYFGLNQLHNFRQSF